MTPENKLYIKVGVGVALAVTVLIIIFRKKFMEAVNYIVWDKVSEQKIKTLHPQVRDKAREMIAKAEKEGIMLRVTRATATWAEQNALYAQGRTDKSKPIVTNAKGGESIHNYSMAFDVVPIVNGKADWNSTLWNKIGEIGKSVGFEWGGDWKSIVDKPHFQMTFGNTLAQLKTKYNKKELKDGYLIV